MTGAFVGAGLAIWLAPRMAGLRRRVTDSARELGSRASDGYQQVSARVDDFTKKSQSVRDGVADAVVRGAHEVERIATAAKTDGVTTTRKHSAAGKLASSRHSL
ncbi:MAG: hypothetical protein A3H96_02870 [Acidobacteria bacterium RIFCSPLOWO2_02_FULL_67_36]|nr:MAG: hypothetical protein A3H96_02870 [Acidobacteria bacterium RIFCSPLOWO2_02_FULL_67_36]OFW22681.1 MAG: hypothetical protein A3G21_10300 [Acidobacteria bacterium RIFCSPLOWO2_12_FULL_66_21]